MKKSLSSSKTFIMLLIITVISLGFYANMLARPISYGMSYHNETVYDGELFEGTMKLYSNGTMVNINTNFDEEMKLRYYYKEGYIFLTVAQTDEEYEQEVTYINENFEEAVASPFYANEINAFRYVVEGVDGYTLVYTCRFAIVFAVIGAVVELVLIAFTVISLVLCKKSKCVELMKMRLIK